MLVGTGNTCWNQETCFNKIPTLYDKIFFILFDYEAENVMMKRTELI